MATINQKIQTLISDVNAVTGCSDTDLTSAIRTLAAGYGQGGGGGAQEMVRITMRQTIYSSDLREIRAENPTYQIFNPFTLELSNYTIDDFVAANYVWEVPKGCLLFLPSFDSYGLRAYGGDNIIFGNPTGDRHAEFYFGVGLYTAPWHYSIVLLLSDEKLYYMACLRPDALITLADGSTKRVCELTLDDKVLGYNPQGELVAQSLTYIDAKEHKTHSEYDRWIFSDGTVLETVHQHRFYNYDLRRMEYMQRWELGQHALKLDGSTPYLIAHETIKEPTEHYTLFCEFNNYFADGCLSGNRHTPELNLPNKHDDLISKLLINK